MKATPILLPASPTSVRGSVLRLDAPISFWGGVDPATGRLTDPRSPHAGVSIQSRIMMLAATRGSSSSSAVLLELLARGLAPAALILAEMDAILGIGLLVGREMGYSALSLFTLSQADQARFAQEEWIGIAPDGMLFRPPPTIDTDRP